MTLSEPASSPTSFVLDTDIGTDVDDILALGLILGSPELALTAVTTVYGDVELRARMVARTLRTAGRLGPAIVPGRAETASGRAVWWPGHEGALMDGLEAESVDDGLDAIAVLSGSATVASIGPMTNVAEALGTADPGIRHVVAMTGEFDDGIPEHNVVCDVTAAAAVFDSGVPVSVVGLEQTRRLRIDHTFVDRIEATGEFGRLLGAEIRQFWGFTGENSNIPHDPVAVLSLARPDLFRFDSGRVDVTVSGPRQGCTTFTPDPHGPHRVAVDLDVHAVSAAIETRILAAAGIRSTDSPRSTS